VSWRRATYRRRRTQYPGGRQGGRGAAIQRGFKPPFVHSCTADAAAQEDPRRTDERQERTRARNPLQHACTRSNKKKIGKGKTQDIESRARSEYTGHWPGAMQSNQAEPGCFFFVAGRYGRTGLTGSETNSLSTKPLICTAHPPEMVVKKAIKTLEYFRSRREVFHHARRPSCGSSSSCKKCL
jgi:hypothetical protein